MAPSELVVDAHTRIVTARPWLNVRDQPGLSGQIIDRAETGRRVVVFGDQIDGSKYKWLKIGVNGGFGYVASRWTTAFMFENWPCESRVISQIFGVNPERYKKFGLPGHEGIDIAAPKGQEVRAVADGEIYYVKVGPHGSNYGIHVRMRHADSHETIYAHFLEVASGIEVGSVVPAGNVIGLIDNTGRSTGHHLHLTVKAPWASWKWPGNQVDPWIFLKHLP